MLVVFIAWYLLRPEQPSRMVIALDGPAYGTLTELSSVSDVVVIGTVQRIAGREIDHGEARASPGEIGVPIIFYEVAVQERLKGTTPDSIIVSSIDLGSSVIVSEEVSAMRPGDQVVLYLQHEAPEDAPGITSQRNFYSPMSWDNGVFDVVSGNVARARRPDVFERTQGRAEFPLSEVREKAQAG